MSDTEEAPPGVDVTEAKLAYIGERGVEEPAAADSDASRWGYCAVAEKTG